MKNTFLLTIALIIPAFGVKAHAPTPGVATKTQEFSLGTVSFPTSAVSGKAQASFLRGVAALHFFSYDLALEAFRQSTKIEPDFMMGYWERPWHITGPCGGSKTLRSHEKCSQESRAR